MVRVLAEPSMGCTAQETLQLIKPQLDKASANSGAERK